MAAEQRVLAHLNFGNAAELRNAVLGASATRPSTPALGAIFFNSTANRVEYWDGTSWQTLAAEVFTEAAHDSHDHSAIASTIALNEIGQPTGAVSFAGHRITNVATPSDSADAANKSYVDGAVSAEQTARENADAALQSDIDAVAADLATETSARTSADSALDTRVTAVEGQLAALDADFATDAQVTAAVAAETARAEAAEAALAADIVAANAAIDAVEADLATEVARAQAAETALQGEVDAVEADLAAEVTRATAAEGALDTRLTAAEGDINTLETDLAAEVARATGAEAGLASDIADVAADLAAEVTDRANAVASVEGRVTTIENTLPSLATSAQVAADIAAEASRADAYADNAAAAAQAAAIAHADLLAQGLNVKEAVVAYVPGEYYNESLGQFVTQLPTGTYIAKSNGVQAGEEGLQDQMGVQLSVGDRVIYDDPSAVASGIYVVQSGAWVLAADWSNDANPAGTFVFVEKGILGNRLWAAFENIDENGAGLGNFNWTPLTGATSNYSDDNSIVFSEFYGMRVNVPVVAAALVADQAFARKATATIGDGSATSFTVSHTLGADVTVSVRDAATGEVVLAGVSCSSGSVTVEFVSAPAADAYRVVIIG